MNHSSCPLCHQDVEGCGPQPSPSLVESLLDAINRWQKSPLRDDHTLCTAAVLAKEELYELLANKRENEPKPCCGEFDTCNERCVPLVEHLRLKLDQQQVNEARSGFDEIDELKAEVESLRNQLAASNASALKNWDDLEKVRCQLAACGVAALSNTRGSAEEQRVAKGAYAWSASYESVYDAVQREMTWREQLNDRNAKDWDLLRALASLGDSVERVKYEMTKDKDIDHE